MGHATTIPETHHAEGDDARATLRRVGWGRLAIDSFERFRAADGFSHARALGFQMTLTAVPALIAIVGLASVIDADMFKEALQASMKGLAPGPTDRIFSQALERGRDGGTAMWAGLAAALASGTVAMAQIERGANRIYGIEEDRSTVTKYGTAFVLTVTSGVLIFLALGLFLGGSAIAEAGAGSGWSDTLVTAWTWVRWPLGIAAIVVSFALLFKRAPRRRQPSASWLAVGSAVSVVLWVVFTIGLRLYITATGGLGQTYGPLAGLIGVLLWAFLSSLALFLGLALAAQLEAVRAGVAAPTTDDHRSHEVAATRRPVSNASNTGSSAVP